ncbi:MAG: dipeptide epimerase [Candidatus Eremiobacteraeota bacterium]|nr:dipeptide epimerase [Candidatus Eremiobacteraeota bacterium]MBV8366765.1 dipeptide epimerase [Candidatus Eremiobacteraeota bacterium]
MSERAAQLRFQPLDLRLRHRFTIARSSEDISRTLIVHLRARGIDALGEVTPSQRYGETVELIERQLRGVTVPEDELLDVPRALARLPATQRGAMCALDLAQHDYAGKLFGVPAYELFHLDPSAAKQTSFTIGIAGIEETLAKVREAAHMPILKVKLGTGHEVETLESIRAIYHGTIRIDANEGWTPEQAVACLHELARFDLEFCEQPIAAGHPEQLRYVRERSPIPIFSDEDSVTADDLPKLAGCVDGVNVKLVKCGGMREGVRMIRDARALGLKVMIGCMIESSVLTTAAAHLTPLADYADIDGPLLIADDPFAGVTYEGAQLRLPAAPGLGVRARTAA